MNKFVGIVFIVIGVLGFMISFELSRYFKFLLIISAISMVLLISGVLLLDRKTIKGGDINDKD